VDGRHRPDDRSRPRSPRGLVAMAAVAGLSVLTIIAVRAVAADAKGCGSGVKLTVAAAPEVAPIVQKVATSWVETNPRVGNQCVGVQVNAMAPADVAVVLAAHAGGRINIGGSPAPAPTDAQVPAAWIPDSVSWLGRVQAINRDAFDPEFFSLAMSPVVLAAPDPVAQALQNGKPRKFGIPDLAKLLERVVRGTDKSLHIGLAEPRRDTAGLAGAVLLHDAVVNNPAQLPALVGTYRTVKLAPDQASLLKGFGTTHAIAPMSEQAVLAYDAAGPAVPLTAISLEPTMALDYPYAVVTGKPRAITRAAEMFRGALNGPDVRELLTKAGFRAQDGTADPGFPVGHGVTADPIVGISLDDPTKIADVVSIWTASKTPSRILAMVDITASMNTPMILPNGTPATRMQVLQQAAVDGLKLFTDDSEAGLWAYAVQLGPNRDFREVVPIGELNPAQRARLGAAVASTQAAPTDVAALYDTLLAAYQVMKDGYRADRSNTIVVFTDGRNTKPGGTTLDDLQLGLEKLADPTKPIRVVLLGIGPDVNLTELETIAKATGGKAFQVSDPSKIGSIFLNALLRA
jgi:Ca-activated chloride channel homolog